MRYLFATMLLCVLQTHSLYAAYELKVGKRPSSAIDRLPFQSVADMKRIPQDPTYYAKQITPLSASRQRVMDREYNRRYFAPWSMQKMNEPLEDMTWAVRMVNKRKIYDHRKQVIGQSVWEKWIKNAQFEKIDTVKHRAITIRHCNLRALPTNTPAYRDPWKTTEGFPFDYNQNSSLHINTPLYVSHYSKDRRWAFVHSPDTFGWVKFSDIALVDRKFMRAFRSGRYSIVVRDDLVLYHNGKKVSLVKLGTLFPYSRDKKRLLVAEKNTRSYATVATVALPSSQLVAKKPLRFTRKNVAKIAKEFYNEPYGWGGKMLTRDCSATTRDFLGCFGIFLPRNSVDQAKEGKSVAIKGLPKDQKKETIIKNAKPFRSLLFVPGHIGLYLGQYKGEPVIMHTYWGVRLQDFSKYTFARTIISTTEPGKELPQIREKSKLINTLQKIINF